MKRIVVTGPESTGKSTLAIQLSDVYNCSMVEEFARTYINELDSPYAQDDLLEMAKGQFQWEKDKSQESDRIICDTDLLTIKIWSEFKYGNCDSRINQQLKANLPDLYLICYPDLAWEFDPQRENPNDGEELFDIYRSEIEQLNVPFKIIRGEAQERLSNAKKALQEINF